MKLDCDKPIAWFNKQKPGLIQNGYVRQAIREGAAFENDRLTPIHTALENAVAALELATELLYVPEQHQDDEWYEEQKQVEAALSELDRVLGER
jgi:hypothetical protein